MFLGNVLSDISMDKYLFGCGWPKLQVYLGLRHPSIGCGWPRWPKLRVNHGLWHPSIGTSNPEYLQTESSDTFLQTRDFGNVTVGLCSVLIMGCTALGWANSAICGRSVVTSWKILEIDVRRVTLGWDRIRPTGSWTSLLNELPTAIRLEFYSGHAYRSKSDRKNRI